MPLKIPTSFAIKDKTTQVNGMQILWLFQELHFLFETSKYAHY